MDRASELVPVLKARAKKTEKLRQIPKETILDIQKAGLWRILRPEHYGGQVTDFGVMIDVAIELARGCASTSWVYINLISHNWMLPLWPAEVMSEVWGNNEDALIGSTLVFPAGRLERLDNGYLFSGKWPYASGIDASDWMMLGATLQNPDGIDEARIVVVKAKDLEVIDTWFVSGLAGTGSKDVSCDGLFVVESMVFDPTLAREGYTPGTEKITGDAYKLPLIPFIPHLVVAPMIGIAIGAYEDFVKKLKSQKSIFNRSKLADHTTIQLKVAEAGVLADTARLLVRENWREAQSLVANKKRPSLEDRARWRRDAAYASKCCVKVVDIIHGVSGANANHRDNFLQLRHRDVHAAAHQIHLSWDINGPEFGRAASGLPVTSSLL
ncbi:MAG: acyl-CoA dehydrogenase family protein [Pseudomonadota bacterium]|nr:acyl-CoA dehydrogenase family protein [Pseudomonadota bacterium]